MSVLPEPRGDPVVSANALQPLANYTNNNTSLWSLNGAVGPTGGVSQIVAGSGISVSPIGGTGVVTVSASAPIVSGTSYRTTVILTGGANDTAVVLDTTNPTQFPPSTDYSFTMTGPFSTEGQSTCDTTIGQISAMGAFSILPNGSVGFLSGSAVNTLAPANNNPGNFYLNKTSTGISIVTTSASGFTGCTFQFVWTQVFLVV